MTQVAITTGVWLLLAVVGVGLYYAYTRLLPAGFIDALYGWKTKTFGIIIAASPDILNFLSFIQVLGGSWEPSETVTWVMRGIGMTVTVLRYISDKEGK